MEINRRQTLGVLGLAAAAAALPASAARASTPPRVGAGSSVTDSGCLWAEAQCAVPVVAVRARLLAEDRTTVLTTADLALVPGQSATDGRWESQPLSGLPLGNHWLEVEATSEDGGVGTVSRVCVLWITATVAITVTPTVIDDDHRVVTVSGTAMGRHPLTGVVAPIAGRPVTVRCLYYPIPLPDAPPLPIVTSAPDGSFTADVALAGNALIQGEVGYSPWDTFITYSVSPQIQVTTNIRSSRLTADLADAALNRGESTAVVGVLEGLADGQWRPLAGRVVLIAFVPVGADQPKDGDWRYEITDAQGRFAHTVTPTVLGHYAVKYDSDTLHTAAAVATSRVRFRSTLFFDSSNFILAHPPEAVNEPNRFVFLGRFLPESPVSGFALTVLIQFRSRSGDPWQTIATTSGDLAGGAYVFGTDFVVPGAGRVRAFVAQSDHYQAATSGEHRITFPWIPVRPAPTPDPTPRPLPPQRGF